MPTITDDDIRALAAVHSDGALITSCYLDVDGSRYVRPADYEVVLDNMVKRVRRRPEVDGAVGRDLDRIIARVKEGFDRSTTRGVAVYACEAIDLFDVHLLPVSLRNELIVNPAPALGQLQDVVQRSVKLAVLAADKQHARVFVYRLGELVERTERTDELPRDYDSVGVADRGNVEDHRQELEQQHLRAAVELLWTVFQSEGFDHLLIAAPDAVAGELERGLHPYLAERLHGRLDLSPGASEPEVRGAVMEAERAIEAAEEQRFVDELRAAVHGEGRGVAEIDRVLEALHERRVDHLLVSDGYAAEGWLCPDCDRLARVGRACTCGAEMTHVADIVEEAIDTAVDQSARVTVCNGNADLDVLGRIGALLRF